MEEELLWRLERELRWKRGFLFSWFSTFFFCFVEHSYGANHQILKKKKDVDFLILSFCLRQAVTGAMVHSAPQSAASV